MKRIENTRWMLALAFLGTTVTGAQVTCPLLSGGGSLHGDGTILVLGQFAAGAVAGPLNSTEQGAVPCWLEQSACAGDTDGDGQVDLQDLSTLLAHFGTQSGATTADGDVDGDGDVDLQDLAAMLSAFGSDCP